MSRKSLILSIVAALILFGAIAAAVIYLYRPSSQKEEAVIKECGAVAAVPSDAAVLMTFPSMSSCRELLGSDFCLLSTFLCPSGDFSSFLAKAFQTDAGGWPCAVSLHYGGSMVPLFVLEGGREGSDSEEALEPLKTAAAQAGLSSSVTVASGKAYFVASPSETIVTSSVRHLSEGLSLLDDAAFKSLYENCPEREVLYVSNRYASNILQAFFAGKALSRAPFLKGTADWSAFAIKDFTRRHTGGVLRFFSTQEDSCISAFIGSLPSGEVQSASVLPADCRWAVILPVPDAKAFQDSRNNLLDACSQLQKHTDALAKLKSANPSADPSVFLSQVREVALAGWTDKEGKPVSALFFRGLAASADAAFKYAGCARVLFGDVFSLEDESCCLNIAGWTVVGSQAVLDDYVNRATFASAGKSDVLPQKDCRVAVYCALSGDTPLKDWMNASTAAGAARSLAVSSDEYMLLASSQTSHSLEFVRMSTGQQTAAPATRKAASGQEAAPVQAPAVPSGPFEVFNCLTKRTNLLSQQDNKYLVLSEKDGKALWSIPFDKALCGRVEMVDYYANTKQQFLFAAGRSLYLLDRLGRFVSGFPVDLGKNVLLGPAVYDFSGAKRYSVMVLHTDNTLEMYNLHGAAPSGWTTICPEGAVLSLPELKTGADNARYWAVPTAAGTELYGFGGGQRITDKKIINSVLKQ